tara:strand:- start:376842 stop:377846 length:1005 start_codon:yes stop_codon:yes gene_type:complete
VLAFLVILNERNVMQVNLSDIDIDAVRNLDAEAAEILQSAVKAAARILARRKAMNAAGLVAEPLYVLAGETHLNPCEYIHHILLLEALKQGGGAIVSGVEVDHDYYEKESASSVAQKGSDRYLYDSFDFAADCYDAGGAAYGRKTLFSYLANQKRGKSIVPIFNDASCSPFDELELDDEYARAAVKDLSINPKHVDVVSPEGLEIRNKVMLDITTQLAAKRQRNIIYQLAGFYHVGGSAENVPEASMSAMLDKAQRQHFNIYTARKPQGAYTPQCGEDIICHDIPVYEAFRRNALKLMVDDDTGEYIRVPEREKEFVDTKLDVLGLSHLKPKSA